MSRCSDRQPRWNLVLFGTAVIAGVTRALREIFSLSSSALGVAISSEGHIAGALIAGRPRDRHGSRDMLRPVGALYAVASSGSGVAWNLAAFAACRFLDGIAMGIIGLAPVHLSESQRRIGVARRWVIPTQHRHRYLARA